MRLLNIYEVPSTVLGVGIRIKVNSEVSEKEFSNQETQIHGGKIIVKN